MATRTITSTRALAGQAAEDHYCIEYAKTGRAKCTECSKAIASKALRLGVGAAPRGKAPSYKWQHWECVKDRTISKIGSTDRLTGLQELASEDQDRVQQRFASGGKAARKGVHTLFG